MGRAGSGSGRDDGGQHRRSHVVTCPLLVRLFWFAFFLFCFGPSFDCVYVQRVRWKPPLKMMVRNKELGVELELECEQLPQRCQLH